jgi:hypothetical protein
VHWCIGFRACMKVPADRNETELTHLIQVAAGGQSRPASECPAERSLAGVATMEGNFAKTHLALTHDGNGPVDLVLVKIFAQGAVPCGSRV